MYGHCLSGGALATAADGAGAVEAAAAAVVDKLLAMDADDLDLMLTHPAGIRGQVCS